MEIKPHWKKLIARVVDPALVTNIQIIETGGSDRYFYRIYTPDENFILHESDKSAEFADYTSIGAWLYRNGISVPEIIASLPSQRLAVFADAGSISLQSMVRQKLEQIDSLGVIELYKNVLQELIKIQKLSPSDFPDAVAGRKFDPEYYRWETDYFYENCVELVFKYNDLPKEEITAEFEKLSTSFEDEPVFPVHRDFQSQNIHIFYDRCFILDYQGARIGSSLYDPASLLMDPYVELPEGVHDALFKYYFEEQKKAGVRPAASFDRITDSYRRVSLQRLMQALGAYGNLGINKRKEFFLQYIPPAVRQLYKTLSLMDDFPRIKELSGRMKEDIENNRAKFAWE